MGGAAGAAAAASLFAARPDAKAVSRRRKGRLDDVEHVVILMQENRSVDHYYGTMRGVRGFGDRAALRGVFRQPDPGRPDGGFLLPWHVDTSTVDGKDPRGHDHIWGGVHAQWTAAVRRIANTGEGALTYFTRDDVPFQQPWLRGSRSVTTISARSRDNPLWLFQAYHDALGSAGAAAVQMQVYSGPGEAQRGDVGPGAQTAVSVPVAEAYDLAVHGPNGFLCEGRHPDDHARRRGVRPLRSTPLPAITAGTTSPSRWTRTARTSVASPVTSRTASRASHDRLAARSSLRPPLRRIRGLQCALSPVH
jgi:hypothetical protein